VPPREAYRLVIVVVVVMAYNRTRSRIVGKSRSSARKQSGFLPRERQMICELLGPPRAKFVEGPF
jgi:hypothetical protein